MNRLGLKTITILSTLCLLILSGFLLKRTIPFEIQSLLAKSNPVRIQYEEDRSVYNDEILNWILVKGISELKDPQVFLYSQEISAFLEGHFAFVEVLGPHNAKYFSFDQQGFSLQPFFKDQELTSEASKELETELWKNSLINETKNSFLISFKTATSLSSKQERPVFANLEKQLNQYQENHPGLEIHLLGAKTASSHFFGEMQLQQRLITPALILVIIFFFYFSFRSWQVVAWSLYTLLICYCTTLCLIILLEGGLGPYSSFALMFAFIVATTDLIHFFGRFMQIQGTVEDRLSQTLKIAWFPCLLTSLTTAAGFIALIVNQNLPIRYFGIYCAFGCLLEWILIFYILPHLMRAFNFKCGNNPFDANKLSQQFEKVLSRFSNSFMIGGLLILALGTGFTLKLKIDDNFFTKFEDNHPLTRSLNTFSQEFNFVGTINVLFKPKGSDLSGQNLQNLISKMRDIENELIQNQRISRITSISQLTANLESKIALQTSNKSLAPKKLHSTFQLLQNYQTFTDFYSESEGTFRSILYLKSLSTEDLTSVLATVESISKKYPDLFEIRPSGFSVIRNFINGRVILDFAQSFILSFFLIFICYLILYRNFKWSLMALIPNAIPLLAVSGAMGFLKVPVDTNLVILICVAFGISGDNTVHLTYVLQSYQKQGLNFEQALKKAYDLIGVAIIATSAIFICSLPVFQLGHLRLFDQIAVFLSWAFIVAFVADAFIFPTFQKKLGWNIHPKEDSKNSGN